MRLFSHGDSILWFHLPLAPSPFSTSHCQQLFPSTSFIAVYPLSAVAAPVSTSIGLNQVAWRKTERRVWGCSSFSFSKREEQIKKWEALSFLSNQVLAKSSGRLKGACVEAESAGASAPRGHLGPFDSVSGLAPSSDLSLRWDAFISLCRTQEPTQDQWAQIKEGLCVRVLSFHMVMYTSMLLLL